MKPSPTTPRRSPRKQNQPSTSTPPSSAPHPSNENETPTKSPKMTLQRPSPYLPTPLETILLSIYPATLLLGALFALLDPSTRRSTYNPTTQSHPTDSPPSYFAKKNNIFNQVFVKQGWAWISISYFIFIFTHASFGPPRSLVTGRRRIRAGLRWAMVTVCWIFVTQWFFGPGIIDRGFVLTGGKCEVVEEAARKGFVGMDAVRRILTHMACKAVGGKWKGGHDISGHVFLLVLGSLFLLEEVVHVILRSRKVEEERMILMSDGTIQSAEVEVREEYDSVEDMGQLDLGVKVVFAVVGLSIFMLSMTAIYFHTWFEKLMGLLVAYSGIFVTYFLPRGVPAMRNIIGMPGV